MPSHLQPQGLPHLPYQPSPFRRAYVGRGVLELLRRAEEERRIHRVEEEDGQRMADHHRVEGEEGVHHIRKVEVGVMLHKAKADHKARELHRDWAVHTGWEQHRNPALRACQGCGGCGSLCPALQGRRQGQGWALQEVCLRVRQRMVEEVGSEDHPTESCRSRFLVGF